MVRGRIRIDLCEGEVERCRVFAVESAGTQQSIEFGSSDTLRRGESEVARDTLIGKPAELAFAKFLEFKFGILAQLDFDVYPRGRWDTEDVTVNGHAVDVKATRQGGQWLLVELNKLEFRKKEDKLPDCFVFATTGWDREGDEPTGWVVLEGFATLKEICNPAKIGSSDQSICAGIPGTEFRRVGEYIPGTATQLQADNCVRHRKMLHQDWDALADHLRKRS